MLSEQHLQPCHVNWLPARVCWLHIAETSDQLTSNASDSGPRTKNTECLPSPTCLMNWPREAERLFRTKEVSPGKYSLQERNWELLHGQGLVENPWLPAEGFRPTSW